ncbi:MAG: amidoligase family protein [Deltaproteobacteria bacterium]|nr:amidoligase family protein [Deltaproteobacteria bacterium]
MAKTRSSARCQWCGEYKYKCTCRHMPFVLPKHKKFPSGPFHTITTKRAIGMEFELAEWNGLEETLSAHYRTLSAKLNLAQVYDSSVRPSRQELVVGPIAGDAILEYIPQLLTLFKAQEVTVNDTCSLHVHVDARDLYAWDIRSFLLLYGQWERDFNRLFPVRRIYNPNSNHGGYAKPLSEQMRVAISRLEQATTARAIKSLLAFGTYGMLTLSPLNSRSFIRAKGTRYIGARYYGCNIHSYLSRGTIEFRQHEGAIDEEGLLWPLFCATYVDLTARIKAYDKLKDLTLKQFVEKYFNKSLVDWFNRRQETFQKEWELHETRKRRAGAH